MKTPFLAMALAVAAATIPAPLAASPVTDDVRCYILASQMAASSNPALKNGGMISAMYYIGKLYGRTPGLDMESLVIAEIPKFKTSEYDADAKRCGDELTARGQQEIAIGKDLQKKSTPPAAQKK